MQFITEQYMPAYTGMLKLAMDPGQRDRINTASQAVFDRVVDRRNTRCLKFDFAVKRGYPEDVLPLWVADMDFRTSSYVEDALAELTRHNIYGYTNTQAGDGFFEAVSGWMKRHHHWHVDPTWCRDRTGGTSWTRMTLSRRSSGTT